MGTDAATEITSVFSLSSGAISFNTSPTTWGFTHSSTMSAPCTALRLSVVAAMPSAFPSEAAFSSWRTEAFTCFGENSSCFKYARSRIPPSFPVPSTASFLPDSLFAMVQVLLTTRRGASTSVLLMLRVQFHSPSRHSKLGGGAGDAKSVPFYRYAVVREHFVAWSRFLAARKRGSGKELQRQRGHRHARWHHPSRRRDVARRLGPPSRTHLPHAVRQTVRAQGI